MTHMLFAPQSVLRNRHKAFARGEQNFGNRTMEKAWLEGVAPLSFMLSEGNMEILEQLQFSPPDNISDLAYSLSVEHAEMMRRLGMLANSLQARV